ncbi:hypothetical protein ACJ64_12985 [Bacillus safensis]|nr:hypothetical protein ACJ64_12985 [Bacillus safensis]
MHLTGVYGFEIFVKYIMRDFLEKARPKEVFHYTNIYGLDGILRKGDFWVSDADFLNDKNEIKYTFELSKEIFPSICKERGLSEEKLRDYTELFNANIRSMFETNKNNFYSLSFCINPDSNLLWANYSQNDGYCIAFDLYEFNKSLNRNENFTPVPGYVIYDNLEQINKLEKLLNDIIDIFEEGTHLDSKLPSVFTALEFYSLFFKDKCFSQEEEYRIIFYPKGNKEIYKCRISNGAFIPYVETEFDTGSVIGVTIGPKNNMDINSEGLYKFLHQIKEFDYSKVKIGKSKIPYRF